MQYTEDQLHKLQQIELEIFDEFVRLCDKHGLSYVLIGGSCLGAIRHNGFIPWDDDIDVGMSRENFNRFEEICREELDSKYIYQSLNTERNCGFVFGKIRKKGTVLSEEYSYHVNMSQGVWIDIFVYDRIPDNQRERTKFLHKVLFLKNFYIVKCGYKLPANATLGKRLAYYLAKVACALVPLDSIIHKLDFEMQRYSGNQSCHDTYPFGGAYGPEKDIVSVEDLHATCEVVFEGRNCKTFSNYKEYLTRVYGNYMELPPIEKRVGGIHNIHELRL